MTHSQKLLFSKAKDFCQSHPLSQVVLTLSDLQHYYTLNASGIHSHDIDRVVTHHNELLRLIYQMYLLTGHAPTSISSQSGTTLVVIGE